MNYKRVAWLLREIADELELCATRDNIEAQVKALKNEVGELMSTRSHIITAEDRPNLNIVDGEKELIIEALKRHNRKRKYAAHELGISERSLYRKIKEYQL